MGCSSSSHNPVYSLVFKAYENKKPIDVTELSRVVEQAPLEQINQSEKPYNWTALECVVLNREGGVNAGSAAKVLLAKGADISFGGKDFDDGAIGSAIRYENYEVLPVFLENLKNPDDWDKVTKALTAQVKVSHPPEGIWVLVGDRKGKTMAQDSSGDGRCITGMSETDSCPVKFEDGQDPNWKMVLIKDVRILPAVPAKMKQMLLEAASTSGCGGEVLERIKGLEEGHRKR